MIQDKEATLPPYYRKVISSICVDFGIKLYTQSEVDILLIEKDEKIERRMIALRKFDKLCDRLKAEIKEKKETIINLEARVKELQEAAKEIYGLDSFEVMDKIIKATARIKKLEMKLSNMEEHPFTAKLNKIAAPYTPADLQQMAEDEGWESRFEK